MIDLLKVVEYGGCSAKLPAVELEKLISNFPIFKSDNVIVDSSLHDDAGVYKISDQQALIFTTDFFPPICSDPYTFGRIAAANSMSDVYAMGGKPILALNINMYPSTLPLAGLADILRGGNDAACSAGVAILGGHTIEDAVPKYGLAVVGLVHPDKVITNSGLKAGQKLYLSKKIGTGAVQAASRAGLADSKLVDEAIESMMMLNDRALESFLPFNPTGGTDITGFGLGGHVLRMAMASKKHITLYADKIPLFDGVMDIYEQGCIPGSTFRNREFADDRVRFSDELKYEQKMLVFDAQTSGGLLFGVDEKYEDMLLKTVKEQGLSLWCVGHTSEPYDSGNEYVKVC